ncbi:hypothetical protein HC928_13910 [bacterium]|nr:hypothetical protein [bacterium]
MLTVPLLRRAHPLCCITGGAAIKRVHCAQAASNGSSSTGGGSPVIPADSPDLTANSRDKIRALSSSLYCPADTIHRISNVQNPINLV